MKPGDEAFFYHSGDERAVVGIMKIAGEGKPDGEDGSWVKVPVEPVRPLVPVTLKAIKAEPSLAKMEKEVIAMGRNRPSLDNVFDFRNFM